MAEMLLRSELAGVGFISGCIRLSMVGKKGDEGLSEPEAVRSCPSWMAGSMTGTGNQCGRRKAP